jgi:glycosyltransferase involved in cell wall biosynthesis
VQQLRIVNSHNKKKISFLVPVYNGEKTIEMVLNSILKQKGHKFLSEIIVIDDGSTDNTKKIVSKFKKVRLIIKPHSGIADTRNYGLKCATGDFIAFVDSDIILDKFWLREIFKKTNFSRFIGATGESTVFYRNKNLFCALDEEIFRKLFSKKIEELDFHNFKILPFQYVFKKSIFKEIGNFDPIFKTNGEDFDWFMRCFLKKNKILYVPTAKNIHACNPPTFKQWIKKQFRISKAFVAYLKNPVPTKYKFILFGKILFFPLVIIIFIFNPILAILLFLCGLTEEFIRGFRTVRNKSFVPLLLLGRFFSAIGQLKTVMLYVLFKKI